MKMIDMFCGGGGMGLGFKQAGWEIVQSFDIDKYAVQMYAHNVESHVAQSDITKLKGTDIKDADLWTFGFPCQDLSVAGKGAGLFKGKRSGLFFEVMRLLSEVKEKPKYLIAENVSGLKPYLPVLKEEFNKAGYVMSYRFFNSKYWGVPQSRPRYFVMGIRQDVFVRGVQYCPVEQQDFIPKLSSILESEVDEKYYISDEKAQGIIEKALSLVGSATSIQNVFTDKDGAAYCCDANYAKGVSAAFTGTGRRVHVFEPQIDVVGHLSPYNPDKHQGEVYRVYNIDGLAPTIKGARSDHPAKILEPQIDVVGRLDMKGKDQWKRVYDTEGLAPTLTAIKGGKQEPKILTSQFRVRKLTPREFARLQGFPEEYEIIVSNSQAYKIFGNAVTVNVAKAIAEVLLNANHRRK